MLGIYIHVPFCIRKCFYCAFDSIPKSKWNENFIEHVIANRHRIVSNENFRQFSAKAGFTSFYAGNNRIKFFRLFFFGDFLSSVKLLFGPSFIRRAFSKWFPRHKFSLFISDNFTANGPHNKISKSEAVVLSSFRRVRTTATLSHRKRAAFSLFDNLNIATLLPKIN